ncbi:MAG TPA: C-GCAxxG-C-C family (seleno)protein [Erysipelotrichaceae bacterium]|jgi:C_GCAxxG_C_C family probable redox protein|nr:C-GCAxxG-C-C family (seleno)protein [Erysipelotrichaceae bacterium]HQB31856.1 C-GCAxxG-C-C family (seleno)protein [Erysipelotrichaceae bacterium]
MFKDVVLNYYRKENDLSCSEAMIKAGNDYFNLNMAEDCFKAYSGFSGGMYGNCTCGAITSAVAILSILYVDERAHTSALMKKKVSRFTELYRSELSATECGRLRELHHNPEIRCQKMMAVAAELLEKVINEKMDY